MAGSAKATTSKIPSDENAHSSHAAAASDDCVGYSLRCTYADGTKVVCAATATLLDGRIVRELGVQAWDA